VGVNPAPTAKINCLLDWAEDAFPTLLPPPAATQFLGPYTYRHYGYSNAYAGVSSVDNHVYYKDTDGVLSDIGALPGWLAKAGCL
jgi:hypothetical protein